MYYSNDDLMKAVSAIFNYYDKDNNGTLEISEVKTILNDSFRQMGKTREITDK